MDTTAPRTAMGPLTVCETNPRYFTDGSGKAVYLTGSHTWNNFLGYMEKPLLDFPTHLEWFHLPTRAATRGVPVSGGGIITCSPPFEGAGVVCLKRLAYWHRGARRSVDPLHRIRNTLHEGTNTLMRELPVRQPPVVVPVIELFLRGA